MNQTEKTDTIRLSDQQILQAFVDSKALQKGHFHLTSGRHSDTYIQCARVLEQPRLTIALARETIARLPAGTAVDMVASPAVGGILFGFAVASILDKNLIFSERVEGRMHLRRSFALAPQYRVLIAEDVVTTGGSVRELIALVEEAKAEVVSVVALIDRGSKPDFGYPYYPLLTLEAPSWSPQECKLCQNGKKLQSPGSRSLAKR
ncbi:MAG: orotate phosphoribosyltransferase [Coriobacteriales bacterium]|jgi:orotate phosphoribosyltransferase|nr:orotate phosphoribosyltransferase [Coriobacteriales bacterium]